MIFIFFIGKSHKHPVGVEPTNLPSTKHCIASGGKSPTLKFFFFAQKAEELSTFLVECIINTSSAKAQIKIKADDQSASQEFSALFQSALSKFGVP